MKSLIVAGGGTGGHVLAGVGIAQEWKSRFPSNHKILFVGARGGLEERLVPRAGYKLELLALGPLNRVSFGRKAKTILQLPSSLLKSAWIVLRERPDAVIGVGGYASGPLVLMARLLGWIWGARVAILEQNAVPGLTNRVLGRFAQEVFSAFPGIENQFPAGKTFVTGNPIRESIKPLPPAGRDPFTVFIFGGSQGSLPVNSLVLESLEHLGEFKSKVRFIHQTGEKDYDRVVAGHLKAGTQARVERFVYDMPAAYGEASLLLCRAGSSTLAEIAAVRRAALLIPLPTASDNHQEKNAQIYTAAGAATYLVQRKSTGKDLAAAILEFVEHPEKIQQIEAAVAPFYRPNAARDIVRRLSPN